MSFKWYILYKATKVETRESGSFTFPPLPETERIHLVVFIRSNTKFYTNQSNKVRNKVFGEFEICWSDIPFLSGSEKEKMQMFTFQKSCPQVTLLSGTFSSVQGIGGLTTMSGVEQIQLPRNALS